MNSKVQPPPIPLSDAVEAVIVTALRRAARVLPKADIGGPDAHHSHSKRTTVAGVDVRVDVTVRGPECNWDVATMNPPKVWAGPSATPDTACSALRPGFAQGGAAVRYRLPCVLVSAHAGDHGNQLGETWPAHCADCGRIGIPLEELTTTDDDGTARDGHLCGPCAARATAPYTGTDRNLEVDLKVAGHEPGNSTIERKDAGGTALNSLGSQKEPAARLLAAHARVARRALDQVEATDVGTAAWSDILYERAHLRSTLALLLDAIDEAQA